MAWPTAERQNKKNPSKQKKESLSSSNIQSPSHHQEPFSRRCFLKEQVTLFFGRPDTLGYPVSPCPFVSEILDDNIMLEKTPMLTQQSTQKRKQKDI